MPQLNPAQQKHLDGLVAEYASGGMPPERRANLAEWLAYRDDRLGAHHDGRNSIRCGLTRAGCEQSVWPQDAQIDHKMPIDRGGRTIASNLHATCAPCNGGKGAGLI